MANEFNDRMNKEIIEDFMNGFDLLLLNSERTLTQKEFKKLLIYMKDKINEKFI